MKIVIIANDTAGLMLFRSNLICSLIEDGDEIVALTPFGNRVDELLKLGMRLINTPMSRRGMNPLKDLRLLLQYYKELKREKPDYVITYTVKPNIYGGLCARCLRIPYAVNITGLGTGFQSSMLKRFVVKMYRIALKKTKVAFCENFSIGEELIKDRIVKKSKICVLNGAGVDLEKFQYIEYPDDFGSIKFLFIGRVMREKGIDELLESMERLFNSGVNCFLTVVGKFEEDYSEKFERYSWLKFEGPQKDVRPFIKDCHCFVLPSWHEGMANTNLECAASGRPIITSDIPGCREAVVDEVSGLLCKVKNTQSLFHAMKKIAVMSRDERKRMGEAGRKHMENNFDKRKVVEKTIALIKKYSARE